MYAPLQQTDFWPISDISLTSSSEALPAKISAARTPRAKASKASGRVSSSKPSASSENAALVGSLLKTALISELGALTGSSPRWRQSATPAGHSWLVLTMPVQTTNGNDPGSSDATLSRLPTPMASDGMKDGAGGGAGSTYPFRKILSTPRASDMKAGGHGDKGRMGTVRHQLQSVSLPTPRASDMAHGPEMSKVRGEKRTGMGLRTFLHPAAHEALPTPTKRDKRMDAWSPAYDKRKSPSMDAVMDGALTDRASDKWSYARQIARVLTDHGLSGASTTLPVVYGWMMGYPPGWLEHALLSAVQKGHLLLPSSSKLTATRSSRKSPKRSDAPSQESSAP